MDENTQIENEIEVKESNVYRLDEMIDAINASIANITTVNDEQGHLVATLAELGKPEFNELIDGIKGQIANAVSQRDILETRRDCLQKVVNACKDNIEATQLIDNVLEGLGIFANN